jgi:hypothetical protein
MRPRIVILRSSEQGKIKLAWKMIRRILENCSLDFSGENQIGIQVGSEFRGDALPAGKEE